MESKKKLIIGIIAICALILVGFYYFSNSIGNFATSNLNDQENTQLGSLSTNPYAVKIHYSPANPSSIETITFNAQVNSAGLTGYSANGIRIYVNNEMVKECSGAVSSCSYTGGPYSAGDYTVYARSYFIDVARTEVFQSSETKRFTVIQYQTSNNNTNNTNPGNNNTEPGNGTGNNTNPGNNNTNQSNNAPSVSVTHSPQNPTTQQSVTFTASATDSDGTISQVWIWVNNLVVKQCSSSECNYTGGPYSSGSYTYRANASDNDGAMGDTGSKTFSVTSPSNGTNNNTNNTNPGNGTNQSAPSVTTLSASGITSTSATLRGEANPNGASAIGWFRYSSVNPGSCSDSFGTKSGLNSLGSGSSNVTYSSAANGLLASTTYYYCAIANNSAGTSLGNIVSFTTSASTNQTGNNTNQTG